LASILLISYTQPIAIALHSSLKDRQEYAQNIPIVFPLSISNDHITKSYNSTSVLNNFLDPYYNAVGGDGTGTQFHKLQTSPGSNTWSAWTSIGKELISDPSVIANQDGRLEAFAISSGNQLYHKWQTSAGSNTWSAWHSLGGVIRSDSEVAVARNSDGRLEVFVVKGTQN
jgi:hypothetical protein